MAERISFLVQGSALQPYHVVFTKEADNLNAICNCPAGLNGQYCKHRFSILAGDASAVVSSNVEDVETVKKWMAGSDIEEAMSELAEAEHHMDVAKKRVAKAKKALALSMRT
jgi:uncharacterized Zn finger protein